MRNHVKLSLAIGTMLALALVIFNWSPLKSQTPTPGEKMMKMEGKMMDQCKAMMDEKAKMSAEMKVQDADLTAEAAAMNAAPENKKLGLLADLVTHMLQHRTEMNARMEKMQGDGMKHMMQHMEMGDGSMSQCPMMKGMMDMGK
jgi:hypothetical protein